MFFLLFSILFLFANSATAKRCQKFSVPVVVSAQNSIYSIPTFQDNLDATTFIQELANIGNPLEPTGHRTVTGTFNISVEFCQPDNANGSNSTLQFPVNRLGVDKTYCDIPFNNFNYSYVDIALNQYGISTIAIDRLGTGASSIVDPVNILQSPAEVSVIYELTKMLRNGRLPNFPHRFSKIVHVGRSFGSNLVYKLAAQYPQASVEIRAAIADSRASISPLRFGNESYAAIAQALLIVAAANNSLNYMDDNHPELGLTLQDVDITLQTLNFGDLVAGFEGPVLSTTLNLPNNYLTWADIGSNQYALWYPGAFGPAIFEHTEVAKQPFGPGELLTAGTGNITAPDFKGPVLVVTYQDASYCGGDCLATGTPNDVEKVRTTFPAAKAFEAYIQPGA